MVSAAQVVFRVKNIDDERGNVINWRLRDVFSNLDEKIQVWEDSNLEVIFKEKAKVFWKCQKPSKRGRQTDTI